MSCSAQFPAKFEFSCVLKLINDVRKIGETGVTMQLIQDALWLSGSMVAAFDPVGVTLTQESQFVSLVEPTLENLCDEIETAFHEFDSEGKSLGVTEASMQALRDNPTSKDWTVFLPLILELVKMILENRKPKPAP